LCLPPEILQVLLIQLMVVSFGVLTQFWMFLARLFWTINTRSPPSILGKMATFFILALTTLGAEVVIGIWLLSTRASRTFYGFPLFHGVIPTWEFGHDISM
jgi:hypothetical protein